VTNGLAAPARATSSANGLQVRQSTRQVWVPIEQKEFCFGRMVQIPASLSRPQFLPPALYPGGIYVSEQRLGDSPPCERDSFISVPLGDGPIDETLPDQLRLWVIPHLLFEFGASPCTLARRYRRNPTTCMAETSIYDTRAVRPGMAACISPPAIAVQLLTHARRDKRQLKGVPSRLVDADEVSQLRKKFVIYPSGLLLEHARQGPTRAPRAHSFTGLGHVVVETLP